MSKPYKPYQPEQDLLLPPSLKDWLPEKHLAYFVSEVVDELDLSGIESVCADRPLPVSQAGAGALRSSSVLRRRRCRDSWMSRSLSGAVRPCSALRGPLMGAVRR